jgi:GT2 family glycosyltransferase/glycosyltransferase involved in cell wall biosynthesis/SAM-dependent methyltransferase
MTPIEKHALAIRLFAAGQKEEALALLRAALGEMETADLWNDWATVTYAAEGLEEAEVGFRIALETDARSAQAAFNLGVLLHRQGRHSESVPFLEQGLNVVNASERAVARQLLLRTPGTATSSFSRDASQIEEYLRKFVSADFNERSYFETHVHRYVATIQVLPDGNDSMRVLELGAAFQHLTPAIRRCKGFGEVRCTDIWPGELQETRCLRSNEGDEEFSVVVDNFDVQLHPWPHEDGSFDVVLCCEMLQRLHTDPLGLFAEINRVLKQDGVLLLTTPNLASAHAVEEALRGGSPYGYGKFEIGGNPTDRHNREYTAGEVERLAIAAGFEVSALRTHDFYWPAKREVLRALASQGHSVARRGDATFLLARKHGAVVDRYPAEFYAASGVQVECRARQSRNFAADGVRPSERAPSRRILLVHELLPHFDCGGADLRLYELVRELRGLGHQVTLLARDGRDSEKYKPPIEALGATVVCDDPDRLRHSGRDDKTTWNFQQVLEQGQFHIAVLSQWFWSGISVAEHYLDDIRKWSPHTRILVLSEDRHGERERRSWQLTGLYSDLERGNDYEQREVEVYQRADLVLYVTETDQRHFLSLLPNLRTAHLSTIAEVKKEGGAFHTREGLLFLANFDNLANQDGLTWLLKEIWPRIRKLDPGIILYIAGHGANQQMAEGHPNVTVLGKIEDLGACFKERRVFVSPIRFGTGIITKNMISVAHGLPVVTTAVGAEGLQLVDGAHAYVADDAQQFADKAVRLYRDEAVWNALAEGGRDYIRNKFSLDNLRTQIRNIISLAEELQPQPADPGHVWSYRAIESTHPEILWRAPVRFRAMLLALAYFKEGRQFLDAGNPDQALRQFRHIFTNIRGGLLATTFHSALLRSVARAYRELGDMGAAARCNEELPRLAFLWTTPVPPDHRNAHKMRQKEKPPEISVIIPTFNREDILRLCLSALAFQSLPADRWEILVVDDGSTDGTEELCRNIVLPDTPIRYFRQENQGAGAARRKGVEMARGEFVVFFNDDTIAGSNLLVEHLTVHRQNPREKLAVLGGFTSSNDCIHRALSLWVNKSSFLFAQQDLQAGQLYDQAFFVTCNLSIRRAAVLDAGSFDPQFRVAEDTELGTRLIKEGFRVKFHPLAGATHEHASFTLQDLLRRARNYGVADWKLFEKHPHLLGDGSSPFGRLEEADFLRIEALLEQKREAVHAGVAALEALQDVEMIPLLYRDAEGKTRAEEILAQLSQVVPMVYWHYLLETFLGEWKDSRARKSSPAPMESLEVKAS